MCIGGLQYLKPLIADPYAWQLREEFAWFYVTWPREPYALHTYSPTHFGIMSVDFGAAAMAHTLRKDTMCCWLSMRDRQPLFNTWTGNRRGTSNHLSDKECA